MASDGNGVGKLAAVAVLLIVALGALALLRYDLFNVRTRLLGETDDRPSRGSLPGSGGTGTCSGNGGGGSTSGGSTTFNPNPPDDSSWRVQHAEPLPQKVTITRKIGNYSVDIEALLVPQGSFIMGESNGIDANSPKRWVAMRDFYMARTEMTNAQYFAFILANGYQRGEFWSQEGLRYATARGLRGTPRIGWAAVDSQEQAGTRRIWALSSPTGEVTVEVQSADGRAVANATVLLLPTGSAAPDYFQFDPVARQCRVKARDQWQDVDGEAVAAHARLKADNLVWSTDLEGRVNIPAMSAARTYQIVAWADGQKALPLGGRVRCSEAVPERGPRMPVTAMSWFEADACARFWGGHLPSEAEWEKAARGTDGRHYPWGNELTLDVKPKHTDRLTTPLGNFNTALLAEVGNFPGGASPYGVLDMFGNATEWCADAWITRLLADPRFDSVHPVVYGGPKDHRAERGSNCSDDDRLAAQLQARRYADPYTIGNVDRGFRVAFTIEEALGRK